MILSHLNKTKFLVKKKICQVNNGRSRRKKVMEIKISVPLSTNTELNSTFSCSMCSESFTDAAKLAEHMTPFHKVWRNGKVVFPCEICNQRCKSAAALAMHQEVHMDDKPFIKGQNKKITYEKEKPDDVLPVCQMCNQRFRPIKSCSSKLCYHSCERRNGQVSSETSRACYKASPSQANIETSQTNIMTSQASSELTLPLTISHVEDSEKSLDNEISQPELVTQQPRLLGGSNSSHMDSLDTTIDSGSVLSFSVPMDDSGQSVSSATTPIDVVQPEGKSGLAEVNAEQYGCRVCGKTYRKRTHAWKHFRQIHRPDPTTCPICGKTYINKEGMRGHARAVHGKHKPHLCHMCPKAFNRKSELMVHIQVHNGDYPWECDVCHNRYLLKAAMLEHHRVHTGEKPYVCEICGWKFRKQCLLKDHMNSRHSSERNYLCPTCGNAYKSQKNLRAHQKVHTGLRPHVCLLCGKTYVYKGTLTVHYKTTHKGVYIPQENPAAVVSIVTE